MIRGHRLRFIVFSGTPGIEALLDLAELQPLESRFLALKRNFEPKWLKKPTVNVVSQMEQNPLRPLPV